ncbi:MAG: SUMF1/EgtB/PvdO family nonheme iron enzyme [Planctomycetota bacterium]
MTSVRPTLSLIVVAVLVAGVCWRGDAQAAAENKEFDLIPASASRYAVLIGVEEYEACNDLQYCSEDMAALRDCLMQIGFDQQDIVMLTGNADIQPTRKNILEQLDTQLKAVNKDDWVVVAFSGHGAKIDGKSYFLPSDASLKSPESTMIPVEELYCKLENCPARLKLVLVDACSDHLVPAESMTLAEQDQLIDGFARSLSESVVPKGVALLTSCTSGERSWSDSEFQHSVFMHFVLEGLKGRAEQVENDTRRDYWVSLFELFEYVRSKTKTHVLRTRRVSQSPSYQTSLSLPNFRLTQVLDFDLPTEVTNSVGMKLTLIPAGEFMMGRAQSSQEIVRMFDLDEDHAKYFSDESPQHRVRITKPFYLGVHEVTEEQWKAVMNTEPWSGLSRPEQEDEAGEEGAEVPGYAASHISWKEARKFCEKLSSEEGVKYRLPTEAEWEYACRAGSTAMYHFGDDVSTLGDYAWYEQNAYEADEKYSHRIGQKEPNSFGLHDMHGNVWEWCQDWYGEDYYATSPANDPMGPEDGSARVHRGGSWYNTARSCRSANRSRYAPSLRSNSRLGFRVARDLPGH